MDDTICCYSQALRSALINHSSINPDPRGVSGFYLNLEPKEGAIEAVKYLDSIDDVYILTCPSIMNPISYMEKRLWIEKYFGFEFCKKLILSYNKGLLKGDILIDDYACGRGQENFEGKVIQYGSVKFPNWETIVNDLKSYIKIMN